jgi:hypothetical protein
MYSAMQKTIRILGTTGLPDTVIPKQVLASDIEALVTLIDALDAIGETALATEMADWWENAHIPKTILVDITHAAAHRRQRPMMKKRWI